MPVSREKWKDFALRGASLIFEVLLEDVYSQGRTPSLACPYSQLLREIEEAKAKDIKKKKPKAARPHYLPGQQSFSFAD